MKTIFTALILFLLGTGIATSFLALAENSNQTNQNVTITYERYDSVYYSGGFLHVKGDMNNRGFLGSNGSVYYYVSNVTYSSVYSGESVKVQASNSLYQLSPGEIKSYSGNITVSLTQGGLLTVSSQIPQVIRLVINTSGMEELAWAGFLEANASVSTTAYVNGTGTLTLVFSNGTSLTNVTVPLKVGQQKFSETLSLVQVTPNLIAHSTREVEVEQNFPRRYAPEYDEFQVSNSSVNSTASYNTTLAYFNGSLVPALVWKGEGLGIMDLGFGKFGVQGSIYHQFETVEFFGVNGTVLGYVHTAFLSREGSRQGIIANTFSSLMAGELKIVTGSVVPPKPEVEASVRVHGIPVVVIVTDNGSAESTAYVNLTHPVYVVSHGHGEGAHLVEVSVNGTYQFFVVTPSGHVINVTPVRPENVTETVLNMSGAQYPAQRVVVNANGSIIFNITLLKNEPVVVYKEVNGSLVALNSTNYFIVNGRIVVYDDPSNVYYVAYGVSPTTSTSSTSTSGTTSTPSSSSSGTSVVVYAVVAVVIIIIVVAALIFLRRK